MKQCRRLNEANFTFFINVQTSNYWHICRVGLTFVAAIISIFKCVILTSFKMSPIMSLTGAGARSLFRSLPSQLRFFFILFSLWDLVNFRASLLASLLLYHFQIERNNLIC